MKDVLGFTFGKLNKKDLKFHYLRIGKSKPLLDALRDQSEDIQWIFNETDTFQDYHFGGSYEEYDAVLINLEVDEDNVSEVRRDFWEHFIWKTHKFPHLLAIVIPNTQTFGSLSKSQITEALSLVRLTNRPFKLFENKSEEAMEIVEWMSSMSAIVHRKIREKDEEQDN